VKGELAARLKKMINHSDMECDPCLGTKNMECIPFIILCSLPWLRSRDQAACLLYLFRPEVTNYHTLPDLTHSWTLR
jgi:hypothetical protein